MPSQQKGSIYTTFDAVALSDAATTVRTGIEMSLIVYSTQHIVYTTTLAI